MNGVAMYTNIQVGESNDLVLQHVDLVKRIAFHLMGRLPHSIQVDDLIQAGMLGLLESLKNYDASRGASFDTYAGIRIRGSMLDEVRRLDWTPRSVHKKSRMVSTAITEVEHQLGRDASPTEIAEHLQIEVDEYHHILQDSVGCKVFSVEQLSETGDNLFSNSDVDTENPAGLLEEEKFQSSLVKEINSLPERERLIVSLYYNDELNLREIGEVIHVSESRVSQILSQAMLRLRSRLGDWVDKK